MLDASEPAALQLNSGHTAGHISAVFAKIDGSWAAVTAGKDNQLVARHLRGGDIRTAENPKKQSLHCLTLSPDGSMAAAGDEGGFITTWSLPGLTPGRQPLTRCSQRCCCTAWNKDSSQVVAAADDGQVKVITVKDSKVSRILRHESGPVRGLGMDPEGTYIAAAGSDGTVLVWEAATGTQELKKRLGPKIDHADSVARQALAWHPDGGQLLAVAGPDHDVLLLERLSWKPESYLSGGHDSNVGVIAFSPNGVYAATGDANGKVVVWLVDKAVQIGSRQVDARVTSLCWHPQNNALLVGAADGQWGTWVAPVPQQQQQQQQQGDGASQLPSPWQPIDELLKEQDQAAAAAAAASNEDNLEDDMDDDEDAGAAVIRRRGLKQQAAATTPAAAAAGDMTLDNLDEILDLDDLEAQAEAATAARQGLVPSVDPRGMGMSYGGRGYAGAPPPAPKPQGPVYPGSTPEGDNGARFLAYNRLGCVVSKAVDDHHVVEVSFHDTSKHRARVPTLTDFYGFFAASMGPRGVAYISKAAGAEQPSMLVYRCFESWAPSSDWTAALPEGEDALLVAAGSSTVAVATSARLLRLYSHSGRQLAIISLPGQPIAAAAADPGHVGSLEGPLAAASQHLLAVVWARGPPTPHCKTQQLAYAVYDVSRASQCCCGQLALSPGSKLTWLGFSREGLLATMDSAGVLRVRSPDWGGAWLQLLDAASAKASAGADGVWPAWLEAGSLLAVVTNSKMPHPQVNPRPLITPIPLSVPGAPSDAAPAGGLEEAGLRLALDAAALKAAADTAEDPGDAAALSDELEAAHLESDKAALRLFNAYLKAGRQGRALELVGGLHRIQSIQGALKLANHHHLPSLAERISAFLEERLQWEEQQQQQQQQQQHSWGAVGAENDMHIQQDQHSQPAAADEQQQRQAAVPRASASAAVFGGSKAANAAASAGVKRKPAAPDVSLAKAGGGSGNPFARKKVAK